MAEVIGTGPYLCLCQLPRIEVAGFSRLGSAGSRIDLHQLINMSYSLLPHGDEEAAVFPPAYSSSSSSSPSGPAQNYVHLNAPSEDLVTSLTLDTDQQAVFGRFKDEQEQKDAKNALLGGRFVDVKIALQGTQRAKLELQQNAFTFHRRVVQIVSS